MPTNIELKIPAGTSIQAVSGYAVAKSCALKKEVRFDFNGVTLWVNPNAASENIVAEYHRLTNERAEAYRKTDEFKDHQARREKELKEKQLEITNLENGLEHVVRDQDRLVSWLGRFSSLSDDIGVHVNSAFIVDRIENAGYVENDLVGQHVEKNSGKFARWIVGQALSGLKSRGRIHPICTKFADDYRKKFSN